jgi:hypothetical protein
MHHAPDEIETEEFSPMLHGYSREDVQAYLRKVSEDVRRLEAQLEKADSVAAQTAKVVSAFATEAGQLTTACPQENLSPFAKVQASEGPGFTIELKGALSELTDVLRRLGTPETATSFTVFGGSNIGAQRADEPTLLPSTDSQWRGKDRRGSTRPWRSRQHCDETQTEWGRGALVAPDSLEAKDSVGQTVPTSREQQNRLLIAAYLGPALGRYRPAAREGTENPDPPLATMLGPSVFRSATSLNPVPNEIFENAFCETTAGEDSIRDNVVPLKRTAS